MGRDTARSACTYYRAIEAITDSCGDLTADKDGFFLVVEVTIFLSV